jgi:hypothetical protein
MAHADTVIDSFIRPDGSYEHIVAFNPETGEKVVTYCGQGFADTGPKPVVVGYGEEAFTIGKKLYETDFSDLDHWAIQIQQSEDSALKGEVKVEDGVLDLYMPAIGCTAWFKQKFEGQPYDALSALPARGGRQAICAYCTQRPR